MSLSRPSFVLSLPEAVAVHIIVQPFLLIMEYLAAVHQLSKFETTEQIEKVDRIELKKLEELNCAKGYSTGSSPAAVSA